MPPSIRIAFGSRKIITSVGAAIVLIAAALGIWSILPQRQSPTQVSSSLPGAPQVAGSPSDWPHLRGPHYDAISADKDVVDSWPVDGPPVLWTRELGEGYSGFAVVQGRAYTQIQSLAGQYVVCLDAETGTELWRYRYDSPWKIASTYPGPYATPTWYHGRIYFASPSGLVGCVDGVTGQPFWSVNVVKKFSGRGTDFGYACTPLVEDGRVILPVGGEGASVVALNAEDGATVWTSGNNHASYCPAFPIRFRGQPQIVAFLRNSLVGLEPKTGRQLWRQALSADYDEHSAWPLYSEPHLFIASPFRAGAQLFRLQQEGDRTIIRPVWTNRQLSNDILSSILVDGFVYGFDLKDMQARDHRPSRGEFRCLEFATGKVRWSTDRTGHANVLAADGKLILLSDAGMLILARISANGYEELGRVQVLGGGLCWTSPALYHCRLYVRNQHRAACVFLGKPETLSPAQRDNAVSAADIPQSPVVGWTRLLPYEPEYPFDAPTQTELRLWYSVCMVGVFGVAGLIASFVHIVLRIAKSAPTSRRTSAVFWSVSLLLGLAGTTGYSRLWETFVYTWPAALFVVYFITVVAVIEAERQPGKKKHRRLAEMAVLIFLGVCFGYFELCKTVGLTMEWGFLVGFLPGFVVTVPAARRWYDERHPLYLIFWTAIAFSVYFWTSGYFIAWKSYFG